MFLFLGFLQFFSWFVSFFFIFQFFWFSCFFWLTFELVCQSSGSEFKFAKPVCIFPCGFLLVWLTFDLLYLFLALESFVFPIFLYALCPSAKVSHLEPLQSFEKLKHLGPAIKEFMGPMLKFMKYVLYIYIYGKK